MQSLDEKFLRRERQFSRLHTKSVVWSVAVSAVLISFLGFVWTFRTGLRTFFLEPVPLGGDGIGTAYWLRLFTETPGLHLLHPLSSSRIGWPFEYESAYFPSGNWVEYSLIRIYANLSSTNDPTILLKTAMISKIIVVAACTWVFARGIRLSLSSATVLTVCFSLSTFNVIRAGGHFGLGMTWAVPLVSLAGIRAWEHSEKISAGVDRRLFRKILPLAGALVFCGLSGFYWTTFGLLLLSGVALVIVIGFLKSGINLYKAGEIRALAKRLFVSIIFIGSLATGFLIQTLPSVWTQRSDPPLVPTAARSWIEPIVYGGHAGSFFFDVHAFVLRIMGRADLLAFLESRSSWEGRQIGAVAGLAFYVLVIAWGIKKVANRAICNPKAVSRNQADNTQFHLGTFVVLSFLLYLVNPVNFALSRTIFPYVRAWGRVSVFLTLFLVALLLLHVDRVRRVLVRVLLCGVLLLIQFTELNQYRQTFPEGAALAATAREVTELRRATIADIGATIEAGCGIVQIPFYPFPEFDTPRDSNGDYGLLELPMVDRIGYKWSYGAVKNTGAFRFFAPLVNQQPPFGRANLATQIEYAAALRPCAVVVDRTYLYEEELAALATSRIGVNPECIQKLRGEEFREESRYLLVNFQTNGCIPKVSQSARESLELVSSGMFLWQNVSTGVNEYHNDFPLVAVSQQHALMYSLRNQSDSIELSLAFVLLSKNRPVQEQSFRFCIDAPSGSCHEARTDSEGQASVRVSFSRSAFFHSINNITLDDAGELVDQWGVSLRSLSTGS